MVQACFFASMCVIHRVRHIVYALKYLRDGVRPHCGDAAV